MLTVDECERVRYHLGYPNVNQAASLQFGMARPIQTMFLVEDVLKVANLLRPETEDRVRRILKILDDNEAKQVEAVEDNHLTVESIDGIKLRPDETSAIRAEYRYWRGQLARNMGVPVYPGADSASVGGPGYAGPIPVVR